MATFTKPTIQETYNSIINDYQTRTSKTAPLLEKAVIKCLAWAIAGITNMLWNYSLWQYLQIFVQTCGLDVLKYWGGLVGLTYKEGTTTTIRLALSGVTANSVSSGTVWANLTTGVTYTAISSVNTSNSTVLINASASVAGIAGTIANGSFDFNNRY